MRLYFVILLGKLIAFLTRFLKIGGGSAAPGLYALKIEPDLVEKLASQIPKNIVITGTNGKTTTARILAHLATEAGLRVIRNGTGSNLERGIASALIHAFHIGSGTNFTHGSTSEVESSGSNRVGIWELDEAAFNAVAPKLKPDIVVFLNVFRDQLDRYGEIDRVVKNWCNTLTSISSQTAILVNGDDTNTARLAHCFKGKAETFGVEGFKIEGESLEKSTHHKLNFEAKNVKTSGLNGSDFQLSIVNSQLSIKLPIPGIYHIYDAVAAIAAAYRLDLPINHLTNQLINFSPAFGRFEKFTLQPGRSSTLRDEPSGSDSNELMAKQGYIFLIKNPAGATQVFETLAPQIKPEDRLLIALNDNLADGTDVSWIWDAEFEKLLTRKNPKKSAGVNTIPPPGWTFMVSGTRAYDLAVRLKYAGFEPKQLQVIPSLKNALKQARIGLKGSLFILPTYTALLELQSILAKEGVKSHYWEEK